MDYTADSIIAYLKKHLPKERLHHTLGTWQAAQALASRYHISQKKVMQAALLHDAAKEMDDKELIRYILRNRIAVPERAKIIRHSPSLLHGFAAADIARRKFGIKDKDVLEAIALHTIAGPKMSALAKVIYLADITAPGRKFKKVQELRRLSLRNLDDAMRTALAAKIEYVLIKKQWLHPGAVAAWNDLLQNR